MGEILDKVEMNNLPSELPGTSIVTQWVYVTPELAKEFLEKNNENRNIRRKHLQKLIADMREDRFEVSHQGVAFDENGTLIDGQHRCMAIVRSEKPQWLLVSEGLPAKAKQTIDTMARRNASDFMAGKHRVTQAATIKTLLALDEMNYVLNVSVLKTTLQEITNAQIQEAWDRYPQMEEFVPLARRASANVNASGPAGLAAAALLYPETGREFLEGLSTMEGLSRDDPRLALLRYRASQARGVAGSNSTIQGALATFLSVKAAKLFAEGRSITAIRMSGSEEIKIYPVRPVRTKDSGIQIQERDG